MTRVNDLHQKAMSLVDEAQIARLAGSEERYLELSASAFVYESEAAWALVGDLELEPSRSVIFRSAAALALDIKNFREAERLISAALAGNPPDEIADELRDLLEDVYFARHLEVRGVKLSPAELQMTIDGDAVGFGIARSESFVQRLKDFEKLIYRTAERRMGQAFRERGRIPNRLTEGFELFLSVPRAASFAVTLRLGQNTQMALPGLDFSSDTIEDLLDALDVFSRADDKALEEIIPDETYRTNFAALAERISPDGKQVKLVGFSSGKRDQERSVALTLPRSEIRRRRSGTPDTVPDTVGEIVTVVGTLLEADAKKRKEGLIEVVDDSNKSTKISVPRGMMSDIVKPLFEERVQVVATSRDNKLHLISIDLASDTGVF